MLQLLGVLVFAAKAWFWSVVVVQIRWTLPRLRVDQLTSLCYRYLLPLAFACLLGNALYVALVPLGSTADLASRGIMTALGFALVVLFVRRVFFHIRRVGDRISIDLGRGERGSFDPLLQKRAYGAFRRQVKES